MFFAFVPHWSLCGHDGLNIASDGFHHVIKSWKVLSQLYSLVCEAVVSRECRPVFVFFVVVTRI